MARDDAPFPPGGSRRRIGEMLVEDGTIDAGALARAVAAQPESGARLGDILAARIGADPARIAAAAARQAGRGFADLRAAPCDRELLEAEALDLMLEARSAPWRRDAGRTVWAATDPDAAVGRLPAAEFVHAEPRALSADLIGACGPRLAERSALRRPAGRSLRAGFARWQARALRTLGISAAALAALRPDIALAAGLWSAAGILGLNAALWTVALVARREGAGGSAAPELPPRPPVVSLLVPLYREPETLPLLLVALGALDYPPELLDIKIVLEADDRETAAALAALSPPPNVELLIAPPGEPRTKPRALNFALDFARGEIVGIYDAEDQPPPDQVRRVVAELAAAPPEVACVQARLGYYNVGENWLTRCFEIEYASWFDAMLPGLRRFGLPIPLGGTSLFVRRAALEAVGAWDSHNVTEDADLGMALARAGYETRLSRSLTEEEAASRPGAWIRQRSRWLKGYLATWATHMRRPVALLADLGPWRFLGFNAVLLSAALGYLLLPWLWLATLLDFLTPLDAGGAMKAVAAATTAALATMLGAAALGLHRRLRLRLLFLAPTLPAYWALGALAAYLAVWELVRAPTLWRKTQHGVGRIAGALRDTSRPR